MVIAGAGGHAKELVGILEEIQYPHAIFLFNDLRSTQGEKLFDRYEILTHAMAVQKIFLKDPSFALGVGKPTLRKDLCDKLTAAGGILQSIVSPFAHIGHNDIFLAEGLNIMTGAVITASVKIGKGTLVHIGCSVHHDTVVGEFCELSPGCRILGKARLGSYVSVGAGAVVLPGIQVGDHAVIGAGAVVTKDVASGITVVGSPARKIL